MLRPERLRSGNGVGGDGRETRQRPRLQEGAPCRVPSACQQGGRWPLKLEACGSFMPPMAVQGENGPSIARASSCANGSQRLAQRLQAALGVGSGLTHAVGQGDLRALTVVSEARRTVQNPQAGARGVHLRGPGPSASPSPSCSRALPQAVSPSPSCCRPHPGAPSISVMIPRGRTWTAAGSRRVTGHTASDCRPLSTDLLSVGDTASEPSCPLGPLS